MTPEDKTTSILGVSVAKTKLRKEKRTKQNNQ